LLTIARKVATIVRKRRQFCGNRSEPGFKRAPLAVFTRWLEPW
jgi:hypothetical protein